jgi:putative ABC transport system permease protein
MPDWAREVRHRLSSLRLSPTRESEIVEELSQHLDDRWRELIAGGVSSDEAARTALAEFRGRDVFAKFMSPLRQAHEPSPITPGATSGRLLSNIAQDLRYAGRTVARTPGFSATVILTLALGIGAATAIFSVVYGVLLRPLPYPQPDRLTAIWEVNYRGGFSRLADPNFNDFRDQNHSFDAVAKYYDVVASVAGTAEPARVGVAHVSRDFFKVLGVEPVMGRSLAADDAQLGAAPTLLASSRYWRDHLASTRDLSTAKLRIGDRVYSVVGVLPERFEFPAKTDLWLPVELDPESTSRTSHNYSAIGRLRNGVSAEQATRDLAAIATRIVREASEQNEYLLRSAAAVPLQTSQTAKVRSPLYILLGAVGFLLLVACANVTNFLLAQASRRTRELAVRHALGAGRGRLVQQFITEALLLATASGIVAVVIAKGLLAALLALAPQDLPRLSEVGISWPVLGFTAGTSFLVAIGLGVITAVHATSGMPRETLVEGGRGSVANQRSQRTGRAIMAAQLAMTLALLTGASLLGRSLLRVLSVNPGFRIDNVLAMDLQLPVPSELTPDAAPAFRARESQFLSGLIERLHAIPGVHQVAAANRVPMDGGLPDGMFLLVGPSDNPSNYKDYFELGRQAGRRGTADLGAVSSEYFQALDIPLRRGRLFDRRDGFAAPHAAVISESLARTQWPNQDPIGHTIQFGNMDGDFHLLTIVGVVGDTHEYGLEQPPRPTVYVNLLQRPRSDVSVVIHADSDAAPIIAAARAIVHEQAPNVPPRFRTFTQIYSTSLGSRRFNLTLVAVFALCALLLAVAGVYGVVSYAVAQRTQEIGVRMALGAKARDVLALILRQGLTTTIVGVAVGVVGSFVAARTIQSLLFGVTATDPVTFIGVAVSLVAVAGLACYIPARRATKVDPVVALRDE